MAVLEILKHNKRAMEALQNDRLTEAWSMLTKIEELLNSCPEDSAKLWAITFNNFGRYYWKTGNLDQALEYFSRAMRMDKKRKEHSISLAVTLLNISAIKSQKSAHKDAIQSIQQAISLLESNTNCKKSTSSLVIAFHLLGKELQSIGLAGKAQKVFRKALKIAQNKLGHTHSLTIGLVKCIGNEFKNRARSSIPISRTHPDRHKIKSQENFYWADIKDEEQLLENASRTHYNSRGVQTFNRIEKPYIKKKSSMMIEAKKNHKENRRASLVYRRSFGETVYTSSKIM